MARKDIYDVLVKVARKKDRISYGDLSAALHDHPDPHRGLSQHLDDLNMVCNSADLPPISALVVQKGSDGELGQPGPGFCKCPAVQPRPKGDMERLVRWTEYLKAIHETDWPPTLPELA
ncbi:MAG: hypothetical protein HYY17_11730 [Planctomycetes bacterium]|nr:hypothetical protein [Planctomycetota bacterium]